MGGNEIRSLSDRRWGLKFLRFQPVPSIVEIEQRNEERKLELMVEKGRKVARKTLQLQIAGLPRATSTIESIRQIAEIQPDDKQVENKGKKDYAYAFGVLSELMNHIAWLVQLEEKQNVESELLQCEK